MSIVVWRNLTRLKEAEDGARLPRFNLLTG